MHDTQSILNTMPPREEYFGSASELKPDELPTIRDVICYAKFLRDNHHGKLISVTDPVIGKNKSNTRLTVDRDKPVNLEF